MVADAEGGRLVPVSPHPCSAPRRSALDSAGTIRSLGYGRHRGVSAARASAACFVMTCFRSASPPMTGDERRTTETAMSVKRRLWPRGRGRGCVRGRGDRRAWVGARLGYGGRMPEMTDSQPRRRLEWTHPALALVTLALSSCAHPSAGEAESPVAGVRWVSPAEAIPHGRAPGAKMRLVASVADGTKVYALILAPGDDALTALSAFAKDQKVQAAHFAAIGGCATPRSPGWTPAGSSTRG